MKTIRRFIRRYPQQSFLILFNSGVFAWLQTTSRQIIHEIGLDEAYVALFPESLRLILGNSMSQLQNIITHSAFGWLFASMIMMWILSFLRGVMRFLLFCLIIVLGILLVVRRQELLLSLF